MTTNTNVTVANIRQDDGKLIEVLQNSVYPGAKPESIFLVIEACRAQHLDPLTKPFHIVPMFVKPLGGGQGSMRDVIMPGIDLYRIKAHRSGKFVGQSPVEFGPTVEDVIANVHVRYPEWARITVKRKVDDDTIAEFTVTEYWLENYATAGRDTQAPNAMWRKRPFAQLAKCVEAQALRRGFPDSVGAQATFEEMAGKTLEEMADYIDVDPQTGEIKPAADKPAGGKPVSPDADASLAAKLNPQQRQPEPEPEPEPQEPEPADLSQAEADIRDAIERIEKPTDANDVMELIKRSMLSGKVKTELRSAVGAKVKEVTADSAE